MLLSQNADYVEAGAKAAYEASQLRQFGSIWPIWSRMDDQLRRDLIDDFLQGLRAAEGCLKPCNVVHVAFGMPKEAIA